MQVLQVGHLLMTAAPVTLILDIDTGTADTTDNKAKARKPTCPIQPWRETLTVEYG